MPVHRTITETTPNQPGPCNMCRQGHPVYSYDGRSLPQRHHRTGDSTVDWWTETRWDVCAGCATYIDNQDRYLLSSRMLRMGGHDNVKVAYKIAVNFFDSLVPGSKRTCQPSTRG